MGVSDRDYMIERNNKREGYVEKSPLRVSLGGKSSKTKPPKTPSIAPDHPWSRTRDSRQGVSEVLMYVIVLFVLLLLYVIYEILI